MDQMACAAGGIVAIDFQCPETPEVEKLTFNFTTHNLDLIIVDTGGDHLALTDDYAGVPVEMKAVAKYFGKETLRDVSPDMLSAEIAQLRSVAGDRAVLRAIHFFDENERVAKQVEALKNNDIHKFIHLVRASGDSSFRWLQNVYSTRNERSQGIPLALAITEKYIHEADIGACRVHGGGFAGTIQVMLPSKNTDDYITYIEKVFGPKSARILKIRPFGTCFSSM
jgi:galactokinase